MARFDKPIRWEFKLAMFGYGKNCKEALTYALNQTLNELQDGGLDLEAIENHEVVCLIKDDVLGDDDD